MEQAATRVSARGASAATVPLAIVGPTASGKSALALALAAAEPGLEIVSVDSMQVYRGMDVGTAKPSLAERSAVVHHLVDLVDPSEDFTVAMFQREYRRVVADMAVRGARGILVGGTGLYLQAVLDDLELPGRYPEVRTELEHEHDTAALHRRLSVLDPQAAARIEPTNRRRVLRALEVTIGSGRPFSGFGPGLGAYPPSETRIVGLALGRDEMDERIDARLGRQMQAGFLDEVRSLALREAGLSATARQALGYRELLAHVEQGTPLDEAVATAARRTRRFARRQQRWFRRDPRVEWIPAGSGQNPLPVIAGLMRGSPAR